MDTPRNVTSASDSAPSLDSIWKTNNLTENVLEDIEEALEIIVNSDGYKSPNDDSCEKKASPELGTLIVLQSQADFFNNSAMRIRSMINKIRGEHPVGT